MTHSARAPGSVCAVRCRPERPSIRAASEPGGPAPCPARAAPRVCQADGARGRENHNIGGIAMTELHLPDQMRQDIAAMRIVERRSLRQIGAHYGHSEEWAKRRCRAIGLPARINLEGAPRRPFYPVDDILALRTRGMTLTAIGRALGLTKNQVIGRLWRAGLCQPKGQALPPLLDFVALVERIPQTGCRYIAEREPRLHERMFCCKSPASWGSATASRCGCRIAPNTMRSVICRLRRRSRASRSCERRV